MNTSTQTVDTSNNRAKNQLMRDLITKPMDINNNTSPTTKPGISSKAKKLKASFQVSKVPRAALECATPRCNTGKNKRKPLMATSKATTWAKESLAFMSSFKVMVPTTPQ